eukprot:1158052-Pelagomonas_calceolata.AAC.3
MTAAQHFAGKHCGGMTALILCNEGSPSWLRYEKSHALCVASPLSARRMCKAAFTARYGPVSDALLDTLIATRLDD